MNDISQINKIETALIKNDLSKLSDVERLSYYKDLCDSLGLNHLSNPFGYIEFQGRLSLYAKKDCTDQLRKIHKISIVIASKEVVGDLFVVVARANDSTGRQDEDMGAVPVKGLMGDKLANAYLKALTKAKRRVTLSICGLGLLDETEVDSVPGMRTVDQVVDIPSPTIQDYKQREQQEIKKLVNHAPKPTPEEITNNPPPDWQPYDLGDWEVPIGKNKGKKLKDVPKEALFKSCQYIVDSSADKGEEIKFGAKDLIENVELYHNVKFTSLKEKAIEKTLEQDIFDEPPTNGSGIPF